MQVAGRTNDSAGDGTTTASILARDMIQYGLQAVSAGMNPVPIKNGIDATVVFLEEELRKRAIPVTSGADIQAVATISAGNDTFVGELIADALDKVGKDGVLTIETSSGLETTVDVTEGMEIERGYISPQFITNQEKMLVEFENCRVLVTDHKIDNMKQLVPILEQVYLESSSRQQCKKNEHCASVQLVVSFVCVAFIRTVRTSAVLTAASNHVHACGGVSKEAQLDVHKCHCVASCHRGCIALAKASAVITICLCLLQSLTKFLTLCEHKHHNIHCR